MAEEKKPKIDLKARLGKSAVGGATPTPPPVGNAPTSSGNVAAPSSPVMGASGPRLPVPGVPVGPAPALDPNNPLSAIVAPRSVMPASVAPQHQRIEVDEMAIQQATGKARKTGLVFAGVALVLGIGAGFVGGQAKEAGDGRAQAKRDAQELKDGVDAAKTKIGDLADKLEAGAKQLSAKEGKAYPKDLANQLGGINVDFDGSKLAGRRFSGFPQDTSAQLFEFVTAVQSLNDHKTAVKNLLTKLEKPITAQFEASAKGEHTIQYVVLLGGPTGKDQAGNYIANIATLSPAITFTGDSPQMPAEIKASFAGQNVGAPKFKGGALNDPSAIYVTPGSFDSVCPTETRSLTAQLGVKLGDLIQEIRGAAKTPGEMEVDVKPGLLERADILSKGLEKVANAK
ncbi:MAG TPA: hypothetical protein VLM85_01945 [Polyangiaceae bacterium]|nr:hypothetical protein [Polyangiaceae bacterium]